MRKNAATDNPVDLARRADNNAGKALTARNRLALREAAELSWLAVCSLADQIIEATKMFRGEGPTGVGRRRKAFLQLDTDAETPGYFENLFDGAFGLHAEAFYEDNPDVSNNKIRDTIREALKRVLVGAPLVKKLYR